MIVKSSILYFIFIVLLYTASSCVSPPVLENGDIQKIDSKIYNEFSTAIGNQNFYDASGSFIEFTSCCDDERTDSMLSDIEELYRIKIDELQTSNELLRMIEYTYSLINLGENFFTEQKLTVLKEELVEYAHRFVDTELQDKGELEKASWLVYLSKLLPDYPYLYKSLSNTFLQRSNYLLAKKYFNYYTEKIPEIEREENEQEIASIEARLDELKLYYDGKKSEPQIDIEDTIKSSVKVMVDRGIKTESGVGYPDQILGTGVIIDERGYIITNYHIIESSVDPKYEGYSRVYVIPGKDENIRFVAKIVGFDQVYDLALLKIEKRVESFIRFGESDLLKQGEKVLAIGNPVGLTNSVTSGVISSIDRPLLQIGNIIQVDAALNPGNSGGALINEDGYLVGIAFAGLENFENLNFAIPSNLLLSLLFRLYEGGRVKRSWLGCSGQREYDYIYLDYIVPEGPTSNSRLKTGDIIKEVNGSPTSEIFDIQNLISYMGNPLIVDITIEREYKKIQKAVVLGERPDIPALYVYNRDAYENTITPLFGIVITRTNPSRKKTYTITRIISNSVASSVGLSEGDIIKIRGLKYDEDYEVFSLAIDLKSKRFGYLDKSMVLYSFIEVNTFI